ncbi:hypothetical protein DPMN_133643 [Dreissena polymorpha]|uniref:Uncharacterized protein n=1 Tax=Dreissena polymorpha TaxID=45954 RepID=A0A9D4JF09_DREPO|nr:hypothetical protein DPMN_133643 [Dreissena polymorpha]
MTGLTDERNGAGPARTEPNAASAMGPLGLCPTDPVLSFFRCIQHAATDNDVTGECTQTTHFHELPEATISANVSNSATPTGVYSPDCALRAPNTDTDHATLRSKHNTT